MSRKIFSGILLFLLSPSLLQAQFSYEISANYGYSIFLIEDNASGNNSMNNNELAPSYSIGSTIAYPLLKQRIFISSGIDYTLFSSDIIFSESFDNMGGFYNDYHRLRIPLLLSFYNQGGHFRLNLGITNNFRLTEKSTYLDKKASNYNIGGLMGFDFIIGKHIILGVELYKDFTPTAKGVNINQLWTNHPYGITHEDLRNAETIDINYYIYRGSIKLGYKF